MCIFTGLQEPGGSTCPPQCFCSRSTHSQQHAVSPCTHATLSLTSCTYSGGGIMPWRGLMQRQATNTPCPMAMHAYMHTCVHMRTFLSTPGSKLLMAHQAAPHPFGVPRSAHTPTVRISHSQNQGASRAATCCTQGLRVTTAVNLSCVCVSVCRSSLPYRHW